MSDTEIDTIRQLIEQQSEVNSTRWLKWAFGFLVTIITALGGAVLSATMEAGQFKATVTAHERRILEIEGDYRSINEKIGLLRESQGIMLYKLDRIADQIQQHEKNKKQSNSKLNLNFYDHKGA